ncbi:MAG: glycosyltransferase family 2 protein [Candidatus Thorarchaeota archaeon]
MSRIVIIIPVFYREHLEKAVRSVLANECDVILVNDSAAPLEFAHPRVHIVENNENLGVGISRNRGVNAALKGKYDFIGFVDSDSVITREWRGQCEHTLRDPKVIGVSGLALNPNQKSRIARVKFALKDYDRRGRIPFQIDCSLFKPEVFSYSDFGSRRAGEDALFISKLDRTKLHVNEKAISYHHEVASYRSFFKKEIVGALLSLSTPFSVARSFLLTPLTCLKMLAKWKRLPEYPFASLIWLFRQLMWNMAYFLGRLAGLDVTHQRGRS